MALDAEFRFVWPDGGLGSAHELFSPDFVTAHRLDERAVPDWSEPYAELSKSGDVSAAGGAAGSSGPEGADIAAAMDAIGWHSDLVPIRSLVASIAGSYDALHFAAGGITTGEGRQYLQIEKYAPPALVERMVREVDPALATPVLLLSDDPFFAAELRRRIPRIRLPRELVESYDALTPAQQTLVDLWLLVAAKRRLGPWPSPLARLAAAICGESPTELESVPSPVDLDAGLRDFVGRNPSSSRPSKASGPFLIRDLGWYLAVCDDAIPVGERARLAQAALSIEPDFGNALHELAMARAASGDWLGARTASLAAIGLAAKLPHRPELAFESLALSISADAVSLALQAGRIPLLHHLTLPLKRLDPQGRDAAFRAMRQQFESLELLQTHETDRFEIIINLRFQLAGAEWISRRRGPSARAAARALRAEPDKSLVGADWRHAGSRGLAAGGTYPNALRHVEANSIRIARAIGAATGSRQRFGSPTFCYVETLSTSPTGLRWAHGWVHQADRPGSIAFAFEYEDKVISGGLAFIPRPDVAATLRDPGVGLSGFAFPVPRSVPDEFGELQSAIRTPGQRRRC